MPIITKETPEIQKKAVTLPFWRWTKDTNLWIDREYFSYDDFQYLIPIYQSVPDRTEDLSGFGLVIMKASQIGGSVIFLTRCYYLMLRLALRIGVLPARPNNLNGFFRNALYRNYPQKPRAPVDDD